VTCTARSDAAEARLGLREHADDPRARREQKTGDKPGDHEGYKQAGRLATRGLDGLLTLLAELAEAHVSPRDRWSVPLRLR
jgi:hypothetical protein